MGSFSLAEVEAETGLAKELLRAWERRYGFPAPDRDAYGDRVYSRADLEGLHQLRRASESGIRIGEAVRQLRSGRLTAHSAPAPVQAGPRAEAILAALRANDIDLLRQQLSQWLVQKGLRELILEVLAPLCSRIGEAWSAGQLSVYQEHIFSAEITRLLHRAIHPMRSNRTDPGAAPVMLLATFTGERHTLGLAMVEGMAESAGLHCINLGAELTVPEIVAAATALRASVVGISISSHFRPRLAADMLRKLAACLPSEIRLIAGGANAALNGDAVAPVPVLQDLAVLERWLRDNCTGRQTAPAD